MQTLSRRLGILRRGAQALDRAIIDVFSKFNLTNHLFLCSEKDFCTGSGNSHIIFCNRINSWSISDTVR